MTAAGPSAQDSLILRELGGTMTFDQLRRYRADGAVPRNRRHGLGRGAGSVSQVHEDALTIARALVAATRPGRARAECVLEVFAMCPEVELPDAGVKNALRWHIQRNYDSGPHSRIAKAASAAECPESAVEAALAAARRERQIHRRIRLAPPGTDLRRFTAALATCMVADALGVEAVGQDIWAEDLAYCNVVELGERGDFPAFGTVARFNDELHRSSVWDQLHGLEAAHTTESQRAAFDRELIDQNDIGALRHMRDALLLVSAALEITRTARELIPHDPILPGLAEAMAHKYVTSNSVHDAPVVIEAGVAPMRWKYMADAVIHALHRPMGYFLERAVDMVFPHLGEVQRLAGRAAAAAASTSCELRGLARELASAEKRLTPSNLHERQAYGPHGDTGCAADLLSLLRQNDVKDEESFFAIARRCRARHLRIQIGTRHGIEQVMRGLSSIIVTSAGEREYALVGAGFQREARKLVTVYRVNADLIGDVIGGLLSVNSRYSTDGMPRGIPISPTGLYTWARTAQYLADEADRA